MLVWCSYCLAFRGEKPPLDDLAMSHGICEDCYRAYALERTDTDKIDALGRLQRNLKKAGEQGDVAAIPALLEEGRAMGIRQVDMLVGLLAPLLWRIGQEWATGQRTVAQEHLFTEWSDDAIRAVGVANPGMLLSSRSDEPRVLLANAEGNHHVLGLRMLSLWLAERGIPSRALTPGLPADEVAALVDELRPAAIGVSVSIADQLPSLQALVEQLPLFDGPILVGGYAVKSGALTADDLPERVRLVRQLIDLDDLLDNLMPADQSIG